ncbi:MaoC family dehydratase N-terminal domain-containing protein [bacterium]|nr:MaoC family dehydratase N-terminal domain-containing protein [bacterium]
MRGEEYTYFEALELGYQWRSANRTVTETDIVNFAGLSGDFNRIHTDAEFAKATEFGQRIAHGLLGLSISSGLQTTEAPWAIVAFANLEWKFSKPIFIGDTVHSESKIIKLKDLGRRGAGIVKIERKLVNQDGLVTQQGVWTLMVGKKPV